MIFLHPTSQFTICNHNKTPVLIPALLTNYYSCTLQKNKGLFQYNFGINQGVNCVGKMDFLRKLGIGCFGISKDKQLQQLGRNIEIDSVVGGQDVMDSAMVESKLPPQHLVVMVNGLIGSSSDWKFAADQFVKQLPDKIMVHCSQSNTAKLTFDGVDLMGERLADEGVLLQDMLLESYLNLWKHQRPDHLDAKKNFNDGDNSSVRVERIEERCCGRIAGLEPMNFITVATPHLGSQGHRQLPFLCGVLFLEKQASQTAHMITGRSGKHLFLTDTDEGKLPLLRMASDSYELKLISALHSFKRRVAYANVNFDHIIGWSTSSIRRRRELPKANLLGKDEKYPHIVYIEHGTMDDVRNKVSSDAENQAIDHEEEMIRGLNQVPWERVDVSFHQSRQRYIAHNTIQVKSYWLNSDGVDVINHMINNFMV